MNYSNELYHYGIKGMKWGRRRFRNTDGTLTPAGKKRYSDDAYEAKQIKKKKMSQMSNAELRKLNERQNLERTHKQLNPGPTKKALGYAAATAGALGTVALLGENYDKVRKRGKKFTEYAKDKAAVKRLKRALKHTDTYPDELYHYGIKGMKWSIRRFENKNGKLTPAGKKRYSDDGGGESKSKHRQNLEAKYVKQGMSQKQAEMAADRRIKTEKRVAAAAGAAAVGAGVYAARKYARNNLDRTIRKGKTFQRIEMQNTDGKLYDRYFVAANGRDKLKYAAMLGNQRRMQTGEAYKQKLKVDQNIKVAGRKTALDEFKKLYDSDSGFRSRVNDIDDDSGLGLFAGVLDKSGKADNRISDKKKLNELYDKFNQYSVVLRDDADGVKYFNQLKNKGYNAIQDINDMKYSGYKAKDPLIIFGASDKISNKSFKKMSNGEINSKIAAELGVEIGELATNKTAIAAATGYAAAKTASNTRKINNYRKEHPNTNMTDKEILKMLNEKEGE